MKIADLIQKDLLSVNIRSHNSEEAIVEIVEHQRGPDAAVALPHDDDRVLYQGRMAHEESHQNA